MGARHPPPELSAVALELATMPAGERFGRIHLARFADPIGFGKSPSRFSDPRRRRPASRFGVLYLGSSLKVCFIEALLRDRGDGRISDLLFDERELTMRCYTAVALTQPLTLVDLRGDGPLRMGIPSDVVRGSRQGLARRWSLAFHDHPQRPDGIIYPSRLNGETNLAVYGRAIAKLGALATNPLIEQGELAQILRDLRIGII